MRKNPRATHVYLNGERISLRNAAKNITYHILLYVVDITED